MVPATFIFRKCHLNCSKYNSKGFKEWELTWSQFRTHS